jgi:hypothetical protein
MAGDLLQMLLVTFRGEYNHPWPHRSLPSGPPRHHLPSPPQGHPGHRTTDAHDGSADPVPS